MGEERGRRNVFIAAGALAAAALAVVLVIVLSGGDDKSSPSPSTQASTTGTTETGNGTSKSGSQGKKGSSKGTVGSTENPATPGTEEQQTRQITPTIRKRIAGPGLQTLRVRDGLPVGGQLRLIYRSGDRVRLRILSNHNERYVIPALGLEKTGGPPSGVTFDFIGKQSGLFGVELRKGGGRTRVAILLIH
jgi:hypothetical protein